MYSVPISHLSSTYAREYAWNSVQDNTQLSTVSTASVIVTGFASFFSSNSISRPTGFTSFRPHPNQLQKKLQGFGNETAV